MTTIWQCYFRVTTSFHGCHWFSNNKSSIEACHCEYKVGRHPRWVTEHSEEFTRELISQPEFDKLRVSVVTQWSFSRLHQRVQQSSTQIWNRRHTIIMYGVSETIPISDDNSYQIKLRNAFSPCLKPPTKNRNTQTTQCCLPMFKTPHKKTEILKLRNSVFPCLKNTHNNKEMRNIVIGFTLLHCIFLSSSFLFFLFYVNL